jgi:hypothetical protein
MNYTRCAIHIDGEAGREPAGPADDPADDPDHG